jgi:hypothetical protein
MRSCLLLLGHLAVLAAPIRAQQPDTAKTPPPISDNSFLVEEAYNQEAGVVQHISNYRRAPGGAWIFTFTQEWPAPSQRHQLSYTLPVMGARGAGSGLGDVLLNYRYQAMGKDEEPVWFSPRLSLLVPTGRVSSGRGAGGAGVQVNLPLSIDVSKRLVTHWNAGATLQRARAENGARGDTRGLNAAASAIWLLSPTLNLMLETAWDRTESLDETGTRAHEDNLVLLPGIRAAINLRSGMQIVPGIGVPMGLLKGGTRDLFLYLSIEHAFR